MLEIRVLPLAAVILPAVILGCGNGPVKRPSPQTEAVTPASDIDDEAFRGHVALLAAETESTVLLGEDGFLFLVRELRSIGTGRFWGDAAAKVSLVSSPEYADPLPPILDIHAQLQSHGIELLFLPVPAKAHVYADKVPGNGLQPSVPPLLDSHHRDFYTLLEGHGVAVLDLLPSFLAARRADDTVPLYYHQDSHWSVHGTSLTARLIAERYPGWFVDIPRQALETHEWDTQVVGDLWRDAPDPKPPNRGVRCRAVGKRVAGHFEPVEPWRESPVLLLGDSYALGLSDPLALELGFPVDLVASAGGGPTISWDRILPRKDGLAGKRLVIWCLNVRNFNGDKAWRSNQLFDR